MIDWTPDDSDQLREYLTRTDSKLIHQLLKTLTTMDAKTFEEVALQAKEYKGASGVITEIEKLAKPASEKTSKEPFQDVTIGL